MEKFRWVKIHFPRYTLSKFHHSSFSIFRPSYYLPLIFRLFFSPLPKFLRSGTWERSGEIFNSRPFGRSLSKWRSELLDLWNHILKVDLSDASMLRKLGRRGFFHFQNKDLIRSAVIRSSEGIPLHGRWYTNSWAACTLFAKTCMT